jgi:biopolymer transport protein ExbD/DNA-directed RNA polymerase subunit RPC12/RpoP
VTKISFACPYCGKKLSASETSAGREKTCPNCRARVVVPTPEVAAQRAAAGGPKPRTAGDHPILMMGNRVEYKDLIDMTAMVDIVFFLLIFFLVTSMEAIEAVLNLPSPDPPAVSENVQVVPDLSNDPTMVTVSIDENDAIEVDGEEAIGEQDLRAKLRAAHQEQDKTGIMIHSSPDASHGKFVMVLDAGAAAGMTEIKFSVPTSDDESLGE